MKSLQLKILPDNARYNADCCGAVFINMRNDKADIVVFASRSAVITGVGDGVNTCIQPDTHDATVNIRDFSCVFALYPACFQLFKACVIRYALNIGAYRQIGEVETMILAMELPADLCILVDLLARKYAKNVGLAITGTPGVLITAKNKSYIKEIKPILDKLIDVGMYVDKNLYSSVLIMAKEK